MSALWEILEGDCRDVLRRMPAGSVHTVVTSPPYFGLRDYGTGEWEGGDPACDHVKTVQHREQPDRPKGWDGAFRHTSQPLAVTYGETCGKCGAQRVDRQIGLEPSPDDFVAALVAVFREVRRVLRDDGTCWLNLGDSYYSPTATQGRNENRSATSTLADHGADGRSPALDVQTSTTYRRDVAGLKPKDLIGIPWMVAFALRADGWYLRSDIIWAKKNCMPESVRDRPTRSHEYIFLLTKNPRYYFDADAVRERVPGLQDDVAADGLLSAAESAELQLGVQSVCEGAGQGMASAGRSGERSRGSETIRANRERESEAGRVSALGDSEAADGTLSGESRGPRGSATSESVPSGQVSADALLPHGERQGRDGSQACQAEARPGDGRCDIDGGGVGGNHGGGAGSVRVLPGRDGADDGSRHPVEQGRSAHEGERGAGLPSVQRAQEGSSAGRNIRSVWQIATTPFPGAHFATFPPKLIEPCVLAGAPERACGECGAPWVRVVERETAPPGRNPETSFYVNNAGRNDGDRGGAWMPQRETLGFEPSCSHGDGSARGVVLDPFAGAGTTGLVALQHGREFVGIELSADYAAMARDRIETAVRLGFRSPQSGPAVGEGQASLFDSA